MNESRLSLVTSRVVPTLCAATPGLLGFVSVVGLRALSPTNVRWIATPDPMKDYLGWAFFRQAPWSLPLGSNFSYGLEKFGSSIFYSDSIPLLAIGLKPFAPLLPEPFQYLGLWMLLCFLLQSYFAWALIGTVTASAAARMLGSLLFVFSPPMLMRVDYHHALVGQWVLLAGLLFNVSPPRRPTLAWSILCSVTALIHPYLLLMVLALWAPRWVGRWVTGADRVGSVLPHVLVVVGCSLLALWQAGAFVIGGGVVREGFGFYRMNAFALLNPMGVGSVRWSYILPVLRGVTEGEYEGFSFLGLGSLVAVAAAAYLAARDRQWVRAHFRAEWIPLALACGALTALALSNQISIGSRVVEYPLPAGLMILGALRASGRFFWPAYYVIVFLSLVVMASRMQRSRAVLLLGLLATMQIVDTSAGWRVLRARLDVPAGPAFDSPLRDPFWSEAARLYKAVRVVPWDPLQWHVFAVYAAAHRLGTDSAYVTRVDHKDAVERRQIEQIGRLQFEEGSFYVLSAELAGALSGRLDASVDRLAQLDGYWVLAPQWYSRRSSGGQAPVLHHDPTPSR